VPPLRLYVAWPEVAIGLLCLAVLLGVTLAAATRNAFSGPLPARSGEGR
jgi:hypothetical protein